MSNYEYIHQYKAEYSRQDISALNRAYFELQSFHDTHFRLLHYRCINNEITQEEFFKEQGRLSTILRDINSIKAQIEEYNRSNNVSHGKLTEAEKRQIYHYYKTGNYKQDALAEMFKVAQSTVSEICSNSLFE